MEEGLRKTFIALVVCMVALSRAVAQEGAAKWLEDFEKKFPPVGRNAAAEELERLSLALGLDPHGESSDERPAKEDVEAYLQAAFGTWLDSQVRTSDDSIASPPPKLAEFLERRQATLWRVVMLLGREVPEWGFDSRKKPNSMPELRVTISLSRILLSAALLEERSGRHAQGANLLEGSWSLYRSVAWQPDLIHQIIGVALAKLQAGVLRKMNEPGFEWLDRLSGDAPKEQMLEAMQSDPLTSSAASGDASLSSMTSSWVRGWRAVADGLRKLSACEISNRSSEEIWKPAKEELERWKEAGGDPGLETIEEISMPNVTSSFRRLARLMVDRELTAKLLQLRFEKAAARPSRWPEKLFDADSRACPGATYEYRSSGAAMSLRFAGSVADPGAPLVLPLSFEARAPRPTPGPSRTPRPTVTPRPSLTPGRARA
jgi:hypothetical protein